MTRNIQATDAQGNKVSEPVQINGVDPTSSGGGAFEDGDGDGIYTLPNAGDGIDVGPADADKINSIRYPDPADNAAGIQAAIDSLSGGGAVYLRPGDYTVDSTITITKDDVTIRGSGWKTQLTAADGLNAAMIQIGDGGATKVVGAQITDLAMDGNKANQTAGDAIHATPAVWYPRFLTLRIKNANYRAIQLESDSSNFNVWGVIANCQIEASGNHAIWFVGQKTRDHFIVNNAIRNSTKDGLNATTSGQNWHHIYQNGFLSNRTGVRMSPEYTNIKGNHFEFNEKRGIYLTAGTGNSVTGNTFRQNSQASVGGYPEISTDAGYTSVTGNTGVASDSSDAVVIGGNGGYTVVTGNAFSGAGYTDNTTTSKLGTNT